MSADPGYKQLSIFDLLDSVKKQAGDLSVEDLQKMADSVSELIRKKEDERRSELERQRREQERLEEEERRREQERLEQERKAHIREVTSMELPLGWENFYASDTFVAENRTESIPDAFIKCLNRKACVDIEYIAALSGKTPKEVIGQLGTAIYQNPETWNECFYKGWETADEYLSGNIRNKLQSARNATKTYDGYFDRNVEALTSVLPPTVCSSDIYITLGSPWVPTHVIGEFIAYLAGNDYEYRIDHNELTGSWELHEKPAFTPYMLQSKYGTPDRDGIDIILRSLNMRPVTVYDRVPDSHLKSGSRSVVNQEKTVLAIEKQKELIALFQKWVWSDPGREGQLEQIYNERYGGIRQRHYDGSFLELPGLDPGISLYPYQKDAVARILFSPNTLLAHDVGSGKTYIMLAAGMELRRLGLSKKNLYVVPNNIVGQWRRIATTLYPQADILCIDPKEFTPKTMDRILRTVRDGDHDAVIMAYSSFTKIPISKKCRVEMLREEEEEILNIRMSDGKRVTKRTAARQQKINEEIRKLTSAETDSSDRRGRLLIFPAGIDPDEYLKTVDSVTESIINGYPPESDGLCFDQLGITRLFVDEAHNFKNVPIETQIENVMGISPAGSKKCKDMMDKVRIVQKMNSGKGVVFATGTPITNSITDAYIMQSYLQMGELTLMGLQSFDGWAGMFAEKTTQFEIDVDTSTYRMATRFARFHNIPELTTLLAGIADFHEMNASDGVPEHDGYRDVLIHKTQEFGAYLREISERAEQVRTGMVKRNVDNMLTITTDGRKAALDMRLVDPGAGFTTSSKVFECAQRVAEIYKRTSLERSTQLVFCDTSTPKAGFNIYDELRGLLVKMGVRAEEIAYIHDAAAESRREKLFENMRLGVIRVLIGSTFKLGLGVNVQNKLIALHHLDVPWRPSDMVQREGRILRQGNENRRVEIFRYITEGSFDAYSWQLLETKQRFINDILSGIAEERDGADVDDTVLDYAEVKALAVGNPLIRKRVETVNELSKYILLQRRVRSQRLRYENELAALAERIHTTEQLIPQVREDAAFCAEQEADEAKESVKLSKEQETEKQRELQEMRKRLYDTVYRAEPQREETTIPGYRGFDIVIPGVAYASYPYVYVRRAGKYRVRIINQENRALTAVNTCLAGLQDRYEQLEKSKRECEKQRDYLQHEMDHGRNYEDEIAKYRELLERIDRELGVGK